MAAIRISNAQARRLWLDRQGLLAPPTGTLTQARLAGIVETLGMVQLDPLKVVARAHDHILWSRNANFRPAMLERLLAKDRAVFEHFTHDAAVLPMAIYPLWRRQRVRLSQKAARSEWGGPPPTEAELSRIYERVAERGPLCARDFESARRDKAVWAPSPHRKALDLLWHRGDLETAHRRNFAKYFDLGERVIPAAARGEHADDAAQLAWLRRSAIRRLGFGTMREIAKFYDAASIGEIADEDDAAWHVPVTVEAADGSLRDALGPPDIEALLKNAHAPSSRMRIVNPFDPIVRDRARAKMLFGFDYRIEIYTPAAKRRYGYYVYPLLEGDRFVGRIELKIDPARDTLSVVKLWPEPGVAFGKLRRDRLDAELDRFARLAGTRYRGDRVI